MESDYKQFLNKFEEESLTRYAEDILSEGMIANARLLSNDKYEFDNMMALFSDRLNIIPNGTSKISKIIKLKGFRDRYVYRVFPWPITLRGNKNDFKQATEEFSKITTSLFSYQNNNINYIGLEQVKSDGTSIGKGLSHMINLFYTYMAMYSKYYTEITPNDIIYRDMRVNMNNDSDLNDIELKAFNLVRVLLVVSDNFTTNNYDKLIHNKKSPINSKKYNNAGDNVILNDLLYAGKYGKASHQYSKIFDNYIGYQGAFEELLKQYDYIINETTLGHEINKDIIKGMLYKIYIYYGEKYIRLRDNNALDQTSLDRYKERVKEAFTSVISEYDIDFNTEDLRYKAFCESSVNLDCKLNKGYNVLSKTKESFEPHEKVPVDTTSKAKEIKLKYKLEE